VDFQLQFPTGKIEPSLIIQTALVRNAHASLTTYYSRGIFYSFFLKVRDGNKGMLPESGIAHRSRHSFIQPHLDTGVTDKLAVNKGPLCWAPHKAPGPLFVTRFVSSKTKVDFAFLSFVKVGV
jgi:hypothetical protein